MTPNGINSIKLSSSSSSDFSPTLTTKQRWFSLFDGPPKVWWRSVLLLPSTTNYNNSRQFHSSVHRIKHLTCNNKPQRASHSRCYYLRNECHLLPRQPWVPGRVLHIVLLICLTDDGHHRNQQRFCMSCCFCCEWLERDKSDVNASVSGAAAVDDDDDCPRTVVKDWCRVGTWKFTYNSKIPPLMNIFHFHPKQEC